MHKKKVLHIGNILNNAYITCKFLRRAGFEADVLNLDYKHVQGQPEWEEVHLAESVSEFDPDWNSVHLGSFRRPNWFYDVSSQELPYLCEKIRNGLPPDDQKTLPRSAVAFVPENLLARTARLIGKFSGGALLRQLKKFYLRNVDEYSNATSYAFEQLKYLFEQKHQGQIFPITKEDIYEYIRISLLHRPLLDIYQLIQGYSLTPIYAMLGNPGQPFICFEHGTLREFPFEDSARGRLYALSLQMAERIIITNADCNLAADRLGLNNYTFIPHPVDETLYCPSETTLRARLLNEHNVDYIFVAPARHHWKNCPQGLENSWFKKNDIMIRALGRLFRQRDDLKAMVIFFEWGQEVELSKQLIEECGFADKVHWEPIRSKPVMKEFYNAADIVFDQFNDGIGTFGTVVPESLACAKPVIINYKKDLHRWCYPELPPLLHASCEEEIVRHVIELCDNESYRLELGRVSREWFLNNHSSKVVIDRTLDIYEGISEKYGWKWNVRDDERQYEGVQDLFLHHKTGRNLS